MKILLLVLVSRYAQAGRGILYGGCHGIFTLFGLMLDACGYDRLIESSRMDRSMSTPVSQCQPDGILMPIALRIQLARNEGVSAVGLSLALGFYTRTLTCARGSSPWNEGMRTGLVGAALTPPAHWNQLFATPRASCRRKPALRLGLREGDTFPLITPPRYTC